MEGYKVYLVSSDIFDGIKKNAVLKVDDWFDEDIFYICKEEVKGAEVIKVNVLEQYKAKDGTKCTVIAKRR